MIKRLGRRAVNILINRRLFLDMPVEDFQSESSHLITLPIRQKIYDILSRFKDSNDEFIVEEYDRLGTEQIVYKRRPIACTVHIDFENIHNWSTEDKKGAFKKIVDIEYNEKLIDTALRGVFYCIIFWVKECRPRISKNQLNTLFLSILKYYYIAEAEEQYSDLDRLLNKYENISRRSSFDVSKVHCFNKFQRVYSEFSWLNSLLDLPLNFLKPSSILSGVFSYNCFNKLEREKERFIEELLNEYSDLKEIFTKFHIVVGPYFNSENKNSET